VVCLFAWAISFSRHSSAPVRTAADGTSGTRPEPSFSAITSGSHFFSNHSTHPGRIIYPYSVIPGGVRTIQDLRAAIAHDPVVSSHYAAFHMSRARIVRLDHERLMHVSYRIGNQVYWTKRTMKLAKGETVITDGEHTARTRCGNQIAELVPSPVSAAEPTPDELDTPALPHAVEFNNPARVNEVFPPVEGEAPPEIPTESNPSSGGQTPPVLVGPVSTNPVPYVPLPGTPPVVHVPEPGTATLLLTAFPTLWLLRRRRSKSPQTSASKTNQ